MTYDEKKKFIINVAFAVTVYAVVYFVFVYVIHWVMPFIVGFLIALALRPVTRFINKYFRIKGKNVSMFVVALFYFVIAMILWLFFTFLWSQMAELIRILPSFYFTRIEPLLFKLNNWIVENAKTISPDVANTLSNVIMNGLEYLAGGVRNLSIYIVQLATGIISNFPLYLISVIFTIVLSIFISVEYSNITSFFKRQLPDKFNSTFDEARVFLTGTLWKMIKAYVIILFITFIELFIGLSLLNVRYALPIAAIIAILDIMPVLGTGGVIIPWAIIELILKNYSYGIGLFVLYIVVTVVRNTVEPRIIGKQIGLHPIVTITVMYAGLRLFGFIGFILAPVTAILIKYLNDTGKIKLFK